MTTPSSSKKQTAFCCSGERAVSYTHLDVYKRQLCYSGGSLQNEQEAIDFLGARLSPQTMERVLQGEETVYRFRLLEGLKSFLSGEGEQGEGQAQGS